MAAVDDLLTCAICLEWFKSPRRLPCYHVYCLECLRGLVKPEKDFITCPECRADHVMNNKKVDEFQVDGRLEQFIQKQPKLKDESDEDYKQQDAGLIKCDHSQPACQQCQTRHRATVLESFLNESRQFHADYLTETQMLIRQKQKSELVIQQTRLETFKTRVYREIKDMINELEKRQLTLLSEIETEEKLIFENLSKLDQADMICAQHTTLMADFVNNVPQTKAIVSLRELLSGQNMLMKSLHDVGLKGILNVNFNRDKVMDMIASYGEVVTDIDYKKDFTLLTTIDGSESGDAFHYPWGLTVCPFTDNVYVTDFTSIRVYSSDGQFIRRDVTKDAPFGLAIDSNQWLIVTSHTGNNVNIYNQTQKLIQSFGSRGNENGQLNCPLGVAFDNENNNIYVVDKNNKRIQVFTLEGAFLSVIGRDILLEPRYIQVNKRQEILVTDSQLGQIVIFSRDGTLLKSINNGEGNNKLAKPVGICLDRSGRIFVADQVNKNIQVYNDDGTHYSTISQPAAAMTSMFGLAVTKSGTFFITDFDRNKVHRIGPILP